MLAVSIHQIPVEAIVLPPNLDGITLRHAKWVQLDIESSTIQRKWATIEHVAQCQITNMNGVQ